MRKSLFRKMYFQEIHLNKKPRLYCFKSREQRHIGILYLRLRYQIYWNHIWERIFPSYAWYKLSLTQMRDEYHTMAICSDPMNGCPGDFAEDHNRRYQGMEYHLYYLEHQSWAWTRGLFSILLEAEEQELRYEISQLPWNQDYED